MLCSFPTRLQLPNGKVVGIKANGEQAIDKVLEPILSQYGLDISDVALHLVSGNNIPII